MSDVWSARDIVLDVDDVEDAINRGKLNHQIPITEEPETMSVPSDVIKSEDKASKLLKSVNFTKTSLNMIKNILSEAESKDDPKTYKFEEYKLQIERC